MAWNLREGIRQAILNNAELAALVGERVWSGHTPKTQSEVWITFIKIFGQEEGSFDGDQKLTHPVFQFTIGGANKVNVDEVQRLLVKLNATQYTYAGVQILFIHKDDRDGWEDGTRQQDPSVDLEIWAEEP